MRRKLGSLLMALGVLLIAGALGLLLRNQREARSAEEAAGLLLPEIVREAELSDQARQETVGPDYQNVPVELLEPEDVEMKEVVINGHAYIGYLSIPALELELPIMSGWTYRKLQIAPCRYYGTLLGRDLVLMAHNYPKHFGKISKLKEGDRVFFTDMEGGVTEYQVVAQDILLPGAVEEMTAGAYDLTLFTCTYGGASRVTVYCDMV